MHICVVHTSSNGANEVITFCLIFPFETLKFIIKWVYVQFYILEGQKKAQYEECEEERKKNNEKIQMLKRDIKEMYQIKSQESTVSFKNIYKYDQ